MPELWQALLERGILQGSSTQWSGLRHQVREAQRRGTFPALPAAKSGPGKGTPWTEDRRVAAEAQHMDPNEADRRTRLCVRHLANCLHREPEGLLNPRSPGRPGPQGLGKAIVLVAVRTLLDQAAPRPPCPG